MDPQLALPGALALVGAGWRWWAIWRSYRKGARAAGVGRALAGRSTTTVNVAALAGGTLLAGAGLGSWLGGAVAAAAGETPSGWLVDVAPRVLLVAVLVAALEVVCRGLGVWARHTRPLMLHGPIAAALPIVLVAAWPLLGQTAAELQPAMVQAAAAEPVEAPAEAAPAPAPAPVADVADIPPAYLALYRQAGGTCAGMDWALLAGVGKVETDHGRAQLPGVSSGANYAGASGPMQFLGPTFREVRGKHPEVGPDVYDPNHAIPAAAHYLCDGGLIAGRGVRAALWTYNHSHTYADDVLRHADQYRSAAGGGS